MHEGRFVAELDVDLVLDDMGWSPLYSELLQNCIHPLSDGANLSFKSKTIGGRRYWYLYSGTGSLAGLHP